MISLPEDHAVDGGSVGRGVPGVWECGLSNFFTEWRPVPSAFGDRSCPAPQSAGRATICRL